MRVHLPRDVNIGNRALVAGDRNIHVLYVVADRRDVVNGNMCNSENSLQKESNFVNRIPPD